VQQNGGVFLGDAPPLPRVEEASHEIGGRAAVDLRALSIVADRHKPRVVAFLLLLHFVAGGPRARLLLGGIAVEVAVHADAGRRRVREQVVVGVALEWELAFLAADVRDRAGAVVDVTE